MKRSIYVGVAVLTAATIAASSRSDCKNDQPGKSTCESSSHGGGGGGAAHGWWSGSGSKTGSAGEVSVARGGFGAAAGAHGAGGGE